MKTLTQNLIRKMIALVAIIADISGIVLWIKQNNADVTFAHIIWDNIGIVLVILSTSFLVGIYLYWKTRDAKEKEKQRIDEINKQQEKRLNDIELKEVILKKYIDALCHPLFIQTMGGLGIYGSDGKDIKKKMIQNLPDEEKELAMKLIDYTPE